MLSTPPLRRLSRPSSFGHLARYHQREACFCRYLASSPPSQTPEPPTRWVSDLKARIGKCILFGCTPAQVERAAKVLHVLTNEWRDLLAGSDGFLTGARRGLEGQAVVWGEMDSFKHVNNVTYVRYAESSRVNWITHFSCTDAARASEWRRLMTPRATGLIMKSIKADYKFPVVYPDRVSVYHKLRSLPLATDTSLVLDCVILSHKHRRIAARTEEDMLIYDYANNKKTTIPPFALGVLQNTFLRQEKEKVHARTKVWALISEVEALEKDTWNRIDAVEDSGTATKRTRVWCDMKLSPNSTSSDYANQE